MKKPVSVRLDETAFDELEYLCNVYGMSKNKVIDLLIRQEYSRYESDPVVKQYLQKMSAIKAILEADESQVSLY